MLIRWLHHNPASTYEASSLCFLLLSADAHYLDRVQRNLTEGNSKSSNNSSKNVLVFKRLSVRCKITFHVQWQFYYKIIQYKIGIITALLLHKLWQVFYLYHNSQTIKKYNIKCNTGTGTVDHRPHRHWQLATGASSKQLSVFYSPNSG